MSFVRFARALAISSGAFLLAQLPPAQAQTLAVPRGSEPGFAWRTEFAMAGPSDIAEGSRALGEIRHHYGRVEGEGAFTLDEKSRLILGATWRRFDFSGSSADVPGSLTALALKLGYARELSPAWSLLAEVEPGIYSDFEDVGGDDFNAPFGLRALYARSRTLQWGFAAFVDPRSSQPVIGGVGARWKFAPQWTLLAFMPAPRVEYAISPDVTLFAGGRLQGGSFRVARDFGQRRGRASLDNQQVDFREITLNAGVRWQLQPGFALNLGAGWMLDRRFEYEERNLLLNGDGAPGFTLSLGGDF